MDVPRILAIADVHLTAPADREADLIAFYRDLVGLDLVEPDSGPGTVCFRGAERRGPRLIVDFAETAEPPWMRRDVLIAIGPLADCAEHLADHHYSLTWSRGWSFYDRRLFVLDPAGHRVELVTLHNL